MRSYRPTPPIPRAPVVVAAALLAGAGCFVVWLGSVRVGVQVRAGGQVRLHYTGGPIQGQHFEQVVGPGMRPVLWRSRAPSRPRPPVHTVSHGPEV